MIMELDASCKCINRKQNLRIIPENTDERFDRSDCLHCVWPERRSNAFVFTTIARKGKKRTMIEKCHYPQLYLYV